MSGASGSRWRTAWSASGRRYRSALRLPPSSKPCDVPPSMRRRRCGTKFAGGNSPTALFFRRVGKADTAMSGNARRTTAAATVCASLALALCPPDVAGSQAVTPSIESTFTDYDTKTCAHRRGRDVEDYGEWRCKGANGMAVLVHAGDQRMTMSFGPRAKNERAAGQT